MKHTRRPFLQYLYPAHAWTLAALWATGLVAAALSLVGPRVIGQLTNLFAGSRAVSMKPITRAVLLLFVSQVAFAAISYWRKWVELLLQEAVSRTLMLDTFSRVVRFSADFFRDREVEKINSRVLDDANTVGKILVSAAVVAPVAVMSMMVFGAVMLAHNIFLGACMIPLALLSRYYILFDRKVQALAKRNREVWDTIRVQGSEAITLAPELRGHFAFEYGLKGLRQSFARFQQVLRDTAQLQGLFQAISPLVAVVQLGTLYWLGAAMVAGHLSWVAGPHPMTWGGIIEFMLIVQLFQQPSKDLGLFLIDWQMTRENRRRVAEYLDQPVVFTRVTPGPQLPAASDVAYDGVSVVAASGAQILNRMNLTIEAGEHVAFCGPAGCGKTTAMQLVVRGTEPAAGRVKLAGRSVEEYDILCVAQCVAFVAQKPLLMNTTIRNNILLGLRRESETSLQDTEGSLDISRLPSVSDLTGLDAELWRVIRLVGLESDVLRKCLDNPAPPGPQFIAPRQRITELQAEVSKSVKRGGETDVVPFDMAASFPGTLGDNVLGPSSSVSHLATAVDRLTAGTADQDFLEQLIKLGYWRLRSERRLAARGSHTESPAPDDKTSDLEIDGTSRAGRRELPAPLRRICLASALATDVELAISYTRDRNGETGAAKFRKQMIEVRRAIATADIACQRHWHDLSSGKYVERLSVRENLLGGRVNPRIHGAAERVDALVCNAIDQLGLMSSAVHMGLECQVGEGGKYLSGGQRQKVAIARAIIKNPSILLLDEATASLDESSQAKIVQLLREGFRNKTVISISHRLSTIRDYDRIIVLDRGEVIQAGSFETLATADGVFRDLVNQEQGKESTPAAAIPAKAAGNGAPAIADLQRRLALSDVFASMESEQLEFLAGAAKVVDCPAGEILFRRGDSGSELYLVLEGDVTFFRDLPENSGAGDEGSIVGISGPGKVFGELALFGYGARTLTARAGAATRLLVLGRDDLMRLMADDHRIAVGILRSVARRLIEVNEKNFAAAKSSSRM